MRMVPGLIVLLFPVTAQAHEAGLSDGGLPNAFVVLPLLLAGGLYVAGVARLWRQAGSGGGLSHFRAASFAAGLALSALMLFSPIDAIAERLLSAHMIQHFGLMLVAAPLMVLGRPRIAVLWAVPQRGRPALARLGQGATGRVWRTATHPFGAWLLYFAVLWAWHMPTLYQLALGDDWVHALQHMSFLGVAVLFCVAVLDLPRAEGRAGAFLAIFATALQSSALAALLTTARTLWYPAYASGAGEWNLSPLEDQQLAGLIMWVPCGAILIGAAIAVLAGILRDTEVRAERVSS
ncbi:cytochrome c oxidase assembly protein [Citreimonas salinaria]|uniref:Putative membrane protein n=1 Tax=Citreimonas salinaria TaxID=321339 RepID=A0A1H3NG15_9RHOB|nr:cytochrome c oxidase assembly protein [Citreimonas salinaria]SDY87129.1 putative membrane protein [Citreimonas salinaria]